AAYRRDETLVLPNNLDYGEISGLSNEVRQKLGAARPRTLGQAGRLDGMAPAALTLLARHPRRGEPAQRHGAPRPGLNMRTQSGGSGADTSADRDRALKLAAVSRETAERLDRLVALIVDHNRMTNLIAASTVPDIWMRHVGDSLQLLSLAEGRTWADLGTGGGFPGLVIARALAERPGPPVHLVGSREKKAGFLAGAAPVAGAPAICPPA